MSITFRSQSGSVVVSGEIRYMARHASTGLLKQVLNIIDAHPTVFHHNNKHPLTPCLPPRLAASSGNEQLLDMALWVELGDMSAYNDAFFVIEDQHIPLWDVELNTAWVAFGDVLRFALRIHAQCEIHTYVEGKHRKWLSNIVERGVDQGILGDEFNKVVEFLRKRDDEPVVTSYSVCESFPNSTAANWMPSTVGEDGEPDWDSWYELPIEKQWELAMQGLRTRNRLELTPDDWDGYFFGNRVNAYTLMERFKK